jgi:hypothetical protein
MMMEGAREQAKHEKEEEMALQDAEKESEPLEEEESKVEPGKVGFVYQMSDMSDSKLAFGFRMYSRVIHCDTAADGLSVFFH